VSEALSPSDAQLVQLAKNGFRASFLDDQTKAEWLRKIDHAMLA
jgi:adenosine deaminase